MDGRDYRGMAEKGKGCRMVGLGKWITVREFRGDLLRDSYWLFNETKHLI